MNLNIEIVGLPASGKTHFYNHLNQKLKKSKNNHIQTRSFKDFLLFEYLKKKTKINLIKKMFYSIYIKNVQIKSNFLFNKEYKDLNLFLRNNLKKNKRYDKILYLYKNYINTTNYTIERKSRMLKNFEIDFLGAKLFNSKFKFNVFDEGFFQKIFFNFESITNLKFKLKKQISYLKLVPNPDLIVLIDTNIKICLKRSKLRADGFLYDNKLIKKSKIMHFNKSVINFAKFKKIPILRLNGASSISKNIEIFFKTIEKYNK